MSQVLLFLFIEGFPKYQIYCFDWNIPKDLSGNPDEQTSLHCSSPLLTPASLTTQVKSSVSPFQLPCSTYLRTAQLCDGVKSLVLSGETDCYDLETRTQHSREQGCVEHPEVVLRAGHLVHHELLTSDKSSEKCLKL